MNERGFAVRLDKFLSITATATRSEAARAVRAGEVLVDGLPAQRADMQIDPDKVAVIFRHQPVVYRAYTYILMHKPRGVVSATEDGKDETVLDLLPPELRRIRPPLFPCGRLDKNTTGLVLLTNNGELGHRLLSPRHHVEKEYTFTVKFPLSEADAAALEAGVDIGGYVTAPCRVERELTNDICRSGRIVLTEGKYHQIKLMMEAVHNQITALSRVRFGPLLLDPALSPGAWRFLTDAEIKKLESHPQ